MEKLIIKDFYGPWAVTELCVDIFDTKIDFQLLSNGTKKEGLVSKEKSQKMIDCLNKIKSLNDHIDYNTNKAKKTGIYDYIFVCYVDENNRTYFMLFDRGKEPICYKRLLDAMGIGDLKR